MEGEMTEVLEVRPVANHCYAIADMDPGCFWCRDGVLGISPQDAKAFSHGQLSQERTDEIKFMIQMAVIRLRDAECAGVQFWMTNRRAMA
jgi:hypothetical protein